jgi:hypothetical protein
MRAPDPVGALVAAASLGVFVAHGFEAHLSRDLGLYAYAGQQVADGVPPYEGVMNRAGPLAHLVPGLGALGARALGIDDLLGMRLLMLVLSVVCMWVVYMLGRDLYESRLAGVVGAGLLISVPGFLTYTTGGPREKTTMLLLLALALLGAVHKRWWWAGAAVALTTLTWQPVFFPAFVAVAGCALSGPRGERLRAGAGVVGGGAVATALIVGYFAAVGALTAFLDGFVRIHLRYTYQPGLYDDLERQWAGIVEGFGVSLSFVIAGLALLVLLAVRNLASAERRRDRLGRAQVAFAAATLLALAWSWRVFNGWADALVLLPFAALGVAGLVAWVAELLDLRVAGVVTAVWVVVVAAIGLQWSLYEGNRLLPKQEKEVEGVFAALPPDATLASVEAPQPLVLTGRTNPTEHQMFRAGLEDYVDDTWPGGLEGFARDLAAEEPTLIAVGKKARYDWLQPVLDDGYTRFGTSLNWSWYVREDVPPDVVTALEAAVRG